MSALSTQQDSHQSTISERRANSQIETMNVRQLQIKSQDFPIIRIQQPLNQYQKITQQNQNNLICLQNQTNQCKFVENALIKASFPNTNSQQNFIKQMEKMSSVQKVFQNKQNTVVYQTNCQIFSFCKLFLTELDAFQKEEVQNINKIQILLSSFLVQGTSIYQAKFQICPKCSVFLKKEKAGIKLILDPERIQLLKELDVTLFNLSAFRQILEKLAVKGPHSFTKMIQLYQQKEASSGGSQEQYLDAQVIYKYLQKYEISHGFVIKKDLGQMVIQRKGQTSNIKLKILEEKNRKKIERYVNEKKIYEKQFKNWKSIQKAVLQEIEIIQ